MRDGDMLAGRYRLEMLLGRGGMGEVWRADDTLLRRPVAVKLLQEALTDPSLGHRFEREALVTAGLRHPGITTVYDAGRDYDRMFLVMELLDGADLATTLTGFPSGLPGVRAVELVRQAAEALAAAHGTGVVHRDLKPANLFLLGGDQLKICDFGIAAVADTTLTRTGSLLGTPAYMSPEQWRGERADERSDLYSLGCVLYALLTGRPPFTVTQSLPALMEQHLNRPPTPPEGAGPELAGLTLRLLAKDPAGRPPNAAALAAELAAIGDSLGVPAAPATVVLRKGNRPVALLDEAEEAASLIDDVHGRGAVLAKIAEVLAHHDIDRASALLRDIRDKYARAKVSVEIVKATAVTDLDRAEELALGVYWSERRHGIAAAVRAIAAVDAERAERLARTLREDRSGTDLVEPLTALATVLAETDVEAALRVARSIDTEGTSAEPLADVVEVVAPSDPRTAERIARSIIGWDYMRDHALLGIARLAGSAEPARAERIARTVTVDSLRPRALAVAARAVAPRDPGRARTLLAEAAGLAPGVGPWAVVDVADAALALDPALAADLLRDAEDAAAALAARTSWEASGYGGLAAVLARVDLDRALRLARAVPRFEATTLIDIAAATDAPALFDEAERLLRAPEQPPGLAWYHYEAAWFHLVDAVAARDPARAEHLARTITEDRLRALALVRLARDRTPAAR